MKSNQSYRTFYFSSTKFHQNPRRKHQFPSVIFAFFFSLFTNFFIAIIFIASLHSSSKEFVEIYVRRVVVPVDKFFFSHLCLHVSSRSMHFVVKLFIFAFECAFRSFCLTDRFCSFDQLIVFSFSLPLFAVHFFQFCCGGESSVKNPTYKSMSIILYKVRL